MKKTIFEKTSRTGRRIQFLLDQEGTLTITLDGEKHHRIRPDTPELTGTTLGKATSERINVPRGSKSYGDIVLTPAEWQQMENNWTEAAGNPDEEYESLESERRTYGQDIPNLPDEMPEDPAEQQEFFANRKITLEQALEAQAQRTVWEKLHPDHMAQVERRRKERIQRALESD